MTKVEEKTLLDSWLVLYRRRWIIIFMAIAAMGMAGFLTTILPPVYEAKAVFFVPKTPDIATYFTPSAEESMARSPLMPLASEDPHAPYIGILKSKAIAELVQKKFPHKRVIDLLRTDMDFSLSNEYMLEVYARDRDPQVAAGIANAYVKYLNKLINEYSLPIKSINMKLLEETIKVNQEKLAQAKRELIDFQEKNRTASLEEEIRQLILQKKEFQSMLKVKKVELKENTSNIAALKEEIEKEASLFDSSNVVITSPLLESLKKDLSDVETKMAGLRAEFKESHLNFINLKNKYTQIEKNVNIEIQRIIKSQIKAPDTFFENLRQQLVGLLVEKQKIQASLFAYNAVLNGLDKRIQEIPKLLAQFDTLEMNVEKNKGFLKTLELNLGEVKMQGKRDLQAVVLVDKAIPPPKPSFPIMWLNLLISGISGILSGIVYCFFVDYIEQTRDQRIFKILKALEKSKKL